MARQNKNGKWQPVIYDHGFVELTELINDKWTYVECDTKEEAEEQERLYKESKQL